MASSCSSTVLSTELVAEYIDDSDESDIDEEEEVSGESRAESGTILLLDRLKSPTPSNLARKRKVHCNPPTGKRRSSGRHGMKEPEIKSSQRVSEFPNEELTVSTLGRLFCKACRETLSVKRSTVANYVESTNTNKVRKSCRKRRKGKRILQVRCKGMMK